MCSCILHTHTHIQAHGEKTSSSMLFFSSLGEGYGGSECGGGWRYGGGLGTDGMKTAESARTIQPPTNILPYSTKPTLLIQTDFHSTHPTKNMK